MAKDVCEWRSVKRSKTDGERKRYLTYWIQEDGSMSLIGSGESRNLRHVCFDSVCEMIIRAPGVFRFELSQQIMDYVQCGRNTERECWFAVIGDEVISVIEKFDNK